MIRTKTNVSTKSIFLEWKCCGYVWQLIVSPKIGYNRMNWAPICPNCGKVGEALNTSM